MLSIYLFENPFRKPGLVLLAILAVGTLVDAVVAQSNELHIVSESKDKPTIRVAPDQETPQGDEDTRALEVVDLELFKPLSDIRVDTQSSVTNKPIDHSNNLFTDFPSSNYPGSFQTRLAAWEAPNIRYQPLYFQDVSLERYGYTKGPILQPIESAAYFGGSLLLLPVELVRDRPGRCVTPLGFCRPGSPAPYTQRQWLIQR